MLPLLPLLELLRRPLNEREREGVEMAMLCKVCRQALRKWTCASMAHNSAASRSKAPANTVKTLLQQPLSPRALREVLSFEQLPAKAETSDAR
mmetsp:Transcript_33865/g.79178  ORF Transcript_33865/g.79178 Transcript_33865/m.79178 type:complete len:93 (-) Transcript_33865:1827-2105(-)